MGQNPLAAEYELMKDKDGMMISGNIMNKNNASKKVLIFGIGDLIACEHCRNAVTEIEQIDLFYEELMKNYPRDRLQSWDKLRGQMPSWESLHKKYGN